MKIQAYTKNQVKALLNHLMVFSSANNNQGLIAISGKNFGEKTEVILKAFEEWTDDNTFSQVTFQEFLGRYK